MQSHSTGVIQLVLQIFLINAKILSANVTLHITGSIDSHSLSQQTNLAHMQLSHQQIACESLLLICKLCHSEWFNCSWLNYLFHVGLYVSQKTNLVDQTGTRLRHWETTCLSLLAAWNKHNLHEIKRGVICMHRKNNFRAQPPLATQLIIK